MKINSSYSFKLSLQEVWDLLQDPQVLVACLPGCQKFDMVDQDTYEVEIKLGVGPVVGFYEGKISITERSFPESYRLRIKGGGPMGTAEGEALFKFSNIDGQTRVDVESNAKVTGVVARVGQRMMGSASRMLMNQFFDCIKTKMENHCVD